MALAHTWHGHGRCVSHAVLWSTPRAAPHGGQGLLATTLLPLHLAPLPSEHVTQQQQQQQQQQLWCWLFTRLCAHQCTRSCPPCLVHLQVLQSLDEMCG